MIIESFDEAQNGIGFNSQNFGSLFDATQTKVLNVGEQQLVKTVSWYDNEMSYVSQLVRTVHYFAKLIQK